MAHIDKSRLNILMNVSKGYSPNRRSTALRVRRPQQKRRKCNESHLSFCRRHLFRFLEYPLSDNKYEQWDADKEVQKAYTGYVTGINIVR